MDKNHKVELPLEVVDKLQLKTGDTIRFTVRSNGVMLQPTEINSQKISLWWSLIPTVVMSIVFYLFILKQRLQQVPLTGTTSIATALIGLGVLSGTIFFIKSRKSPDNSASRNIYWRNFPTIVLSFALILLLALLGIFWVFDLIFTGATFDQLTAIFIFFIFSSVINYLMIVAALSISSTMLTSLFMAIISSGVVISMASNGQRRWWQHNLSFLGTNMASDSWWFNLTLIFSALIMIVLIDYLFVSLQESYPRTWQLMTLRVILTLAAVDLGAVGAFPNNATFHFFHDQLARMLVYFIIILIIGIKWLLPQVKKDFLSTSYIIGGVLVLTDVLFQFVGYLSLTAFELIGFMLAFGWVLLLFQAMQRLILDQTRIFEIKVD
ncbi:AbrB/MazE/SpoVT family DNA-binding domain-containing protein [Paucilactobacillus wasatchensis]|uniref:Uncharacterized protein n=1 Tax=Paucilactobacillus wasatchensis TaxID=1335616 RepID=A0A0D1A7Y0_9LACO|nr:AbrB/MazE/SpoVT family DNA-binding domain-containing protein [Paucilactobacillus wasatchensis]KIS03827.1 hypothetical protein WDC_0568 [Paucilactobacillus wasatchensis]